ncbi:exodeoxyribonuclease [Bacteroidota bacterium]|nr:exodeoxyribonuclease [Bacteroidota bacterium]
MSSQISLITYNVNGIRAAMKKGLVDWLKENKYDVVMLQETKAQPEQIDVKEFENLGYHHFWFSAEKKGYSGVGILTKIKPDQIKLGINLDQYDSEGRVLRMDIGDTTFINTYFPSGTTGEIRQGFKYNFLNDYLDYLLKLKKTRKKIILSGDYNICHQEIDIHDPKGNKNSSGFLPDERAWMTKFFETGWLDTFRHFNQAPHQYTWWSNFFNARANNKGWRIDYHNSTKELEKDLVSSEILPDVKHSDHCPVLLKIKL